MADNEGTSKTNEAIVISKFPDVCLTPVGPNMVPVIYQIISQFDKSVGITTSVNFTGNPVFNSGSYISICTGNEPGVGGGITSGVNTGVCRPSSWSPTVRVEGKWIVRHDDFFLMNCCGPEGTSNTIGKVVYIKFVQMATVNADGTIVVKRKGEWEDCDGKIYTLKSHEKYGVQGNVTAKTNISINPKGTETRQILGNDAIIYQNEPGLTYAGDGIYSDVPHAPIQLTNPPIVPETTAEKNELASMWKSASPWMHGTLDVIGFFPVVGDFIGDGLNAVIYTAEGNYVDAAISATAIIPIAGLAATGGKWIKRTVKYGDEVVGGIVKGANWVKKYGNKALDGAKMGAQHVKKLAKKFGKNILDESRKKAKYLKKVGKETLAGVDNWIKRASKWADDAAKKLKDKWDDFWKKKNIKKSDGPDPKKKKDGGRISAKQNKQELLNELKRKNIKHNPKEVIDIRKTKNGDIVFLEKGTSKAGLQHIIERHADDFARRGVSQEQIPNIIMEAITEGKIISQKRGSTMYEVLFNGKKQGIKVTIGSNGFIVQSNPIRLK